MRLGPHVHEVAAEALGGLDGGHLARNDHHHVPRLAEVQLLDGGQHRVPVHLPPVAVGDHHRVHAAVDDQLPARDETGRGG